ncbi:MAG: SpoIIM [uncultured Chloroflexi bacterium]|uniref:SpoIIM n=1 Tax=uncultured Chloroflexota bacterium TaxID=166587 RepID=A0A6J4IB33_9CHLR|nr:MAG: SpoIIM [uncultured Chloroflexota bacterium]
MPSLTQFITTRREEWAQLEALLARSEGNGLRRLGADELDALGRGYRRVLSDVALAQRDFPQDQLTAWLNQLAARAHLRLYRAPGSTWRRLAAFFLLDFPRRFRQAWRYSVVAALLLLLPALGGYLAGLHSEVAREALVPAQLRAIMQRGETWTDMPDALRPLMAVVIFTNNIGVSFFAFTGGVWFGLGTVYTLVLNGLFLGAIFGAGQHYGVGHLLADFVSSHGYVEITCIIIAGAAGLMLGDALLRPGVLRRRDAATRAGRNALALVMGAVPVFVLVGLVEGNLSPSDAPMPVKLAVGPLLWLALMAWLLLVGRSKARTA